LIAPMAAQLPTLRTVLRTAETLLIAAIGGTVFTLVGFPAGLISGSLLSVAAMALAGRPLLIPDPLFQVISVLVGISLGAVATPETLQGLRTFPVSIAVLLIATVAMTAATTCYLHKVHGWGWQSALFGASPGALAQVMMLATEYRADVRAIAVVQVMRVVLLTIGIPTGLALFGLTATGIFLPKSSASLGSPTELVILVGISTAAAIILRLLRFPGGLIFGAMLASAVLHGTGYVEAVLPWWVVAAAVISIGAVTGSRFVGTDPMTLLRYLGAAFGSFAVAIAVASVFVLALTAFMPLRIADVVVAYAPGAQDTMMVLALALHLDPIFVGAHHLARYILVSLAIALMGRWLGPPPTSMGTPLRAPPASKE
jgi:membrane AbrB-like protein